MTSQDNELIVIGFYSSIDDKNVDAVYQAVEKTHHATKQLWRDKNSEYMYILTSWLREGVKKYL